MQWRRSTTAGLLNLSSVWKGSIKCRGRLHILNNESKNSPFWQVQCYGWKSYASSSFFFLHLVVTLWRSSLHKLTYIMTVPPVIPTDLRPALDSTQDLIRDQNKLTLTILCYYEGLVWNVTLSKARIEIDTAGMIFEHQWELTMCGMFERDRDGSSMLMI